VSPSGPDRQALVQRFLELRPLMQRRFNDEVDRQLHEELESVTIHQLSVLQQLEDDALPMRELARSLGVSESSATASVDRLVRAGLVERSSDPGDRRVVLVQLSSEGQKVVARVKKATCRKVTQMLGALSDSQVGALVDIFTTLAGEPTDEPLPLDRRTPAQR
jgi:DNA-binding MarR family transcriptional regulator